MDTMTATGGAVGIGFAAVLGAFWAYFVRRTSTLDARVNALVESVARADQSVDEKLSERIDKVRAEGELRVANEAKARHDLANKMAAADAALRMEMRNLERDMVRRDDFMAFRSDVLAALGKVSSNLESLEKSVIADRARNESRSGSIRTV